MIILKGVCNCTTDYGGDDCSIDLQIPPVLKATSFETGICDQANSSCRYIPIFGIGFTLSSQMTATISVSYVIKYLMRLERLCQGWTDDKKMNI